MARLFASWGNPLAARQLGKPSPYGMDDKRGTTAIDEKPIGPSIAGMPASLIKIGSEGEGDCRMNRDEPRFLEFCLKNLKMAKDNRFSKVKGLSYRQHDTPMH